MAPPPAKPRPPLPEGPFLVVGLARSGAAVAKLLAGRGARVVGCDAADPEQAESLAAAGVEVHTGNDGAGLLEGIGTLVKSPGVPAEAAVVTEARHRGIPVLGELEIAWRALPNRFIGVTGTNGKTTTCELIGHLYRTAGTPVEVAGNVGRPLSSLAGGLPDDATIVCECSSFQLEDTELFAPECAVFLNLAADHLDRHAGLEEYLEAKLRIFANQANEDVAVVNGDSEELAGRDLGGCARRILFCSARAGDPDCEVSLQGGTIFAGDEPLVGELELQLLGRHNAENAMAAAAATLAMGVDVGAVRDGLRDFPGVPHRLERVAEIGGVLFVNDSKATNVASAAVGLRAFEGGVHVILGGSDKGEDFKPLAVPVLEHAVACYLIGETAERIASELAPLLGERVPLQQCERLENAVRMAADSARAGQVVLLSPACASFDSFVDFEQRGESFRAIVEALDDA